MNIRYLTANALSEHPLATSLLAVAILVIILTIAARLFVFVPQGKHRAPSPDPVHDDDDIDPDWDDDDIDDDAWAYEQKDLTGVNASAWLKGLRDVTEGTASTNLSEVDELSSPDAPYDIIDRPYERIATTVDADAFLRYQISQDCDVDPYSGDWFEQSFRDLLLWAEDQDAIRFRELMEAAAVARDWEEVLAS